jgi:hypothetical protein
MLLPAASVALWLGLFGLPIDPSIPSIESAGAQGAIRVALDTITRSTTSKPSIEPIGSQKRGTRGVLLTASTGLPGTICRLNIKYRDGEADSPDDVLADARGVCSIQFDVADRRSAVGTADARLKVVTTDGITRGKASRSFSVK